MRRPEIGVTVAGNAQNLFDGETLQEAPSLGCASMLANVAWHRIWLIFCAFCAVLRLNSLFVSSAARTWVKTAGPKILFAR